MRKFLLVLLFLVSGCAAPFVDEGVDLSQPINLDKPEANTGVVEPEKASETPQVKPEVKPAPAPPVRQTMSFEAMRALHDKIHNAKVGPRANYRWTYPGSLVDHLRKEHGIDVLSAPSNTEPLPAAAAKENVIIQYSTTWCGVCKSDVKNVIPNWLAKGWKFADPVDETANAKGTYPRYEIRFADGTVKTHSGSLSTWRN
jgi:hypothetical protein